MTKEWFFDRYCGHQLAALVEDGVLMEFSMEKEDKSMRVGNIYKGKVTNVLAGMNAAFVSCGLRKNCYLSMSDADDAAFEGAEQSKQTPLQLSVGDEVLVQVVKPPRGNKGAKVTTQLSFIGKHVIYLPQTEFMGVSLKITNEDDRGKLLRLAQTIREDKNEGFIMRTQATQASDEQVKSEAEYLRNLYKSVLEEGKSASVGTVLYQDEELPVRIMRDSFGEEVIAFHVGDADLHEKLLSLIKLRGDLSEEKLIKYEGERSMLASRGMMEKIFQATRPIVSLQNGAYLVIEHTEAMTVIDVNTGRYVGKTNLEDTVFAVNLEAAKEIARQVRLRNIGGIVVVDFIDMQKEEHRETVTEQLRKYLEQGKAKCNVLPMNELNITQFTRKRLGNELFSSLVKPCSHCAGIGDTDADIFVIMRLRDAILDALANGENVAVVDCNEGIMRKIFDEKIFAIEAKNRWKNKKIYFIPHKTYAEQIFTVRNMADVTQLPDKAKRLQ